MQQRLIASPPQARNAALIAKRARRIPLQLDARYPQHTTVQEEV